MREFWGHLPVLAPAPAGAGASADYDAEFITRAIEGGDDLDYVCRVLRDGTVARHARVNTFERVAMIVRDPMGPTLREALTLSKAQMEQRHGAARLAKTLPSTNEEQQLRQLDAAAALWQEEERRRAVREGVAVPRNVEVDEIDEAERAREKSKADEAQEAADREKRELQEEEETVRRQERWTPKWASPLYLGPQYTWYKTVWYRVNVTHALHLVVRRTFQRNGILRFLEHKMTRYRDAHARAMAYLDHLALGGPPSDDRIDADYLETLYLPLGDSRYADDADAVQVQRVRIQVRPTPVEVLERVYPRDWVWTVEGAAQFIAVTGQWTATLEDEHWTPVPAATPDTHTIYLACVHVLNQITRCQVELCNERAALLERLATSTYHINVEDVQYALRCYKASFVDIFHEALGSHGDFGDRRLLTPYGSMRTRGGVTGASVLEGDRVTPWERHGSSMSTRAFCAGDLPNLFHVLNAIPLWGEQNTPKFRMGKLLHKALPFACQRRHIIKLTVRSIAESDAFYLCFARMVWVVLCDLYPRGAHTEYAALGMRHLLRAKELTSSRERLVRALTAGMVHKGDPSKPGGPLVVYVVLRMFILYLADASGPRYAQYASQAIDWAHFENHTRVLAGKLLDSGILPDDAFGQARRLLAKTVKSPNTHVHRLRKHSLALTLSTHTKTVLEKTIIRDSHARAADLVNMRALAAATATSTLTVANRVAQFRLAMRDFAWRVGGENDKKLSPLAKQALAYAAQVNADNLDALIARRIRVDEACAVRYAELLDVRCKAALLNLLVRVPRKERLTLTCMSVLSLPEYGGVSHATVSRMYHMTCIYYEEGPTPKEYVECVDGMDTRDFVYVAYYFYAVSMLDRLRFIPLDAETVARTDVAMRTRRYHLLSGQERPPADAYEISYAPCCDEVYTLKGQGKQGSSTVAYDSVRQQMVCAHGNASSKVKAKHLAKQIQARVNALAQGGNIDQPLGEEDGDEDDNNDGDDDESDEEDEDDDDDEGKEDSNEDVSDDEGNDIEYILEEQDDGANVAEDYTNVGRIRVSDFTREMAGTTGGGGGGGGKNGKKPSKETEARKRARNACRAWLRVPHRQAVFLIPLRGRALVIGNSLERRAAYLFCPECASLHRYTSLNFSGSLAPAAANSAHVGGRYRCNECAIKEGVSYAPFRRCALCDQTNQTLLSAKHCLPVMHPGAVPPHQWLYFCKWHYRFARPLHQRLVRDRLFEEVRAIEARQLLKDAATKQARGGSGGGK